MSYPGYHQPDFLESIAKGLQVRSTFEEIRARREARAQQAELHRLAIEQHQYQNNLNNFKTAQMLSEGGFLPVHPGTVGKFEAGLGGRGTTTGPDQQQYSAPTPEQRFARTRAQAQQKGELEGTEALAKENVVNPTTTVTGYNPEQAPGTPFSQGTLSVRQKTKDSILEARQKRAEQQSYERANPDLTFHWSENGAGDQLGLGLDKKGNERKRIELPKAGKGTPARSAARKSQAQINLEAEQEVINKHFGGKEETSNPTYEAAIKDAVAKRVASGESRTPQEADWYFRTQDQGQADLFGEHPELFNEMGKLKKATVDVRSTPEFKAEVRKTKLRMMTQGAQTKGAASATAATPRTWTIKQSDVPKAAKLKGMSIEQFLKAAQENGGSILP